MSDAYIFWLESRNTKLIAIIAQYKGTTQALMNMCMNEPTITFQWLAEQLSKLDYEIDLQLNENIHKIVNGND